MWKDSCYFVSVEHTRRISLSLPSSPWPTRPIDGFQLVYTGLYWYLTPIFNVYCPNLRAHSLHCVLQRLILTDQNIANRNVTEAQEEDCNFSIYVSFIFPICRFTHWKGPFCPFSRDVPWIGGTLFQYLSIISIIVDELVFSQTKGVLGVTIHYKLVSIINRWIWSGIESMKLSMFNSARNFWYPAILSGLGILLV